MKSERTKAKRTLKAIDASLLATARQILDAMAEADAPAEVVGVLRGRIAKQVTGHFAVIERRCTCLVRQSRQQVRHHSP